MKLIRTNIADGETTIHEHEIRQFAVNRNKSGKLVYWYEDDFGNGSYPEALVTECTVTENAVHITVNWDN